MNLLWVDVSASVKTYGDLRPGDLVLDADGEPRFRVLGITPLGELQYRGARTQVPGRVSPHIGFAGYGGGILRRWDRLEKLPYTIVLRYDDGEGVWVGFVWVDASTPEDIRVETAISLAKSECMKDNDWNSEADQTCEIEVVCVMQGQCWTEEI